MQDPAIQIERLSKRYRVGSATVLNRTFVELIQDGVGVALGRGHAAGRPADRHFWALRDLNLAVPRGQVLGLIGPNGAGKSTLLKVLSRITDPTEGVARIRGRVGSLLEVGTGFHPELTGRENIFLNGAILGMTRREIRARFDEIVAFSGVERFLDTPVKRYSSGMYVRLAFAVAAHLQPEILLVDEVLAVGDAAFQKKCLGKIRDVAGGGRTVLFVSHNMAAVESLCDQVIHLEGGLLVGAGAPRPVIDGYLRPEAGRRPLGLEARQDRQGNGDLRFTEVLIRSPSGSGGGPLRCGDDLELILGYRSFQPRVSNVSVSVVFYTPAGQCVFVLNNEMVDCPFPELPPEGWLTCRLPRLPLSPGEYHLNVFGTVNQQIADWVQQAAHLTVESGDFFGTGRLPPPTHGGVLMPHRWSVAA